MNSKLKNQYNDLTIYYANELARKYCKFTLEEQKILHLIFSQINPYGNNPTTFKLNKLDFFDKLELESENRYNRYRKFIRGLINKTFFEVKELNGDELFGVVIYNAKWYAKQPFFEVSLNPNFMPYLEQLVKNYTKINLDNALKLRSKHSLTLYKFLCSWTDESKIKNQRYITTKELKELFGLSIDDYVYNGKFHRPSFEKRIINVIIKEINIKTNLTIKFKKNYNHGKVLNYEFNWIQKEKKVTTKSSKKQVSIFDLEKESTVSKSRSILFKSNFSQNEIKKVLQDIDNN